MPPDVLPGGTHGSPQVTLAVAIEVTLAAYRFGGRSL